MIASALFSFSSCLALWAVCEISTVFCVHPELFIVCVHFFIFVTRPPQVPSHSTLETHWEATNTDGRLIPLAVSFDVIKTTGLTAPAKFGIQVDYDVLMKAQILGVDVLRAKLPYVFSWENLWAPMLHTWYLKDASFANFALQVVSNTILAL